MLNDKDTNASKLNSKEAFIKSDVIKKISSKQPLGMDGLIKDIKSKGGKVGVFPISENNWVDTGTKENKFINS